MRAGLLGLGAVVAVTFGAAGANAQDQPKSNQDEGIVVTGRREVSPQVAHRYVRQISSSVDGQLIRFRDPVCPGVAGFENQYNAVIVQRIRIVAADAGIKVGRPDCRPNLILVIATDADGLVKGLRKKKSGIFAGVDDTTLHRAFESGPVHVWNSTEILNEDGERQIGGTLYVKSASIIDLPTQRVITGAMVMIDTKAALGKTLTQIADYTAMRALAGARPPKQGVDADTILTLFDPQVTPPAHATPIDTSYLEGLYASRPTARDTNAKSQISSRILKNAKQGPGKN